MRTMLSLAFVFALVAGNAFAASDLNLDGVTSLSGDGALVLQNLGGSSAGDANGDGSVNLAGDLSAVISGVAADVVAPGTALMKYFFNTGEVKFSSTDPGDSSGPLQLVLTVDNASLTGANAANTTVPFKLQAGTTKDISGLPNQLAYFNGDGFTLDDVTAGLLFSPLGSSPNQSLYHFTYQNAGEDPIVGEIQFIGVPEPSSFVLAGLAGIGLVWFRRRRAN